MADTTTAAGTQERDSFAAGSIIFEAGEPADFMYVVEEGEVEIIAGNQVINTVGPGGILGELALLDHQPRSATARAKSDCTLLAIDEWRFLNSVQNRPFFALEVMRAMAERLRRNTAS